MAEPGAGTRGSIQPPGAGGPEVGLWDQVQAVDAWPEGEPRGCGDTSGCLLLLPSPPAHGSSSLRAEQVGGAGGSREGQGLPSGTRSPSNPPWPCHPRAPSVTLTRSSRAIPDPHMPLRSLSRMWTPGSLYTGPLSVCGQPRVPLPTLRHCSQDTSEASAVMSGGLPRCGGWRRPPALHLGPAPWADGRVGLLPTCTASPGCG